MTLRSRLLRARQAAAASAAAVLLAGCGGGGSNPLSNPPTIENPPGTTGQKLSFAYFQRCINPILLAQLQTTHNGVTSIATCASAGCHDNTSGTGGALRVIGSAPVLNLSDPANTPDAIRAAPIYVSFYSSQASTVIGSPVQSRMLNKPLVRGTLHGGGLIFESPDDPNAKLIEYWISHPMPAGQDEFSSAAANLFEPADVQTGACKTQ